MTKNIKVMVVDDNKLIHVALEALIKQYSDILLIGKALSGKEAIKIAMKLKPHIILMDIIMPGIDGFETSRQLLRLMPDVKIIFITFFNKYSDIEKFIKIGGSGFLPKSCSFKEIIKAIRIVNSGKKYISKKLIKYMKK